MSVTFYGIFNGRPRFSQSEEESITNKGLLPRWLVAKLDAADESKQLNVDGNALVLFGARLEPGDIVNE